MKTVSLNGIWSFKESTSKDFLPATVPGNQFSDLLSNKIIPDPFISENEKDVQWVAEKDWLYRKEFVIDEDIFSHKQIELCFDMVDTLARIYVNNTEIAYTDNINCQYKINVKPYINLGNNTLDVMFYSPLKYIKNALKSDRAVANANGLKGVPHIRKTQSHFGWDWGPVLPTVGLGRDVYLNAYNQGKIEEVTVIQEHDNGIVTLKVTAKATISTEIKIELTSPNNEILVIATMDGKASFVIDKPLLWWTNDLSNKEKQPLYTIKASLTNEENSEVIKKIGLRTITLNREHDCYGRQFQFILNGVPIFAKGGNWIPPDSLYTRFNESKLNDMFIAMRFANMNIVRVWGGGFYESDSFYDKCDELGILVWQDFGFACGLYPLYNIEFLDNVKKEVFDNVKRLRHHPCLALWCGNNEIEMMATLWFYKRKASKWVNIFFHNILPSWLKELDAETPYISGSPTSSTFKKKVNSHTDGDVHLWNVWHGLQPLTFYRKKLSRFCSEFGLESLPDMDTLLSFATKEDLSMDSKVFMAHQKCLSGNKKILYYISSRYNLPKKFEDVAYLSQIVQAECIKDATEHWRRHRTQCNGSIYWQLNDCWPCISWSSIDYYGRYKALHYLARHFNEPVTLSLYAEDKKANLFIINDKAYPLECRIEVSLQKFNGEVLFSNIINAKIGKLASVQLKQYDFSKELQAIDSNAVCQAKMYCNGNLVVEKTVLFKAEKKLNLPNVNFLSEVLVSDNNAYITITADSYARFVNVTLPNNKMPFSDNYFDLCANESKTIVVPIDKNLSEEDIKNNLSIRCANIIEPKYSALREFIFRKKILLSPLNFVMWIIYHFV